MTETPVVLHPTVFPFAKGLSKELEWLKKNHPDKIGLIHLAERFFKFMNEERHQEE